MDDKIPLPASIYGQGPFIIMVPFSSKSGCVMVPKDGKPGIMMVPLDNQKVSIAVRAHEYGHLALHRLGVLDQNFIDLAIEKNIRFNWLQACMDVVVNSFLYSIDVTEVSNLKLLPEENSIENLARPDQAMIFLRSALLDNESAIKTEIRQRISPTDIEVLEETDKELRSMGINAKTDHNHLAEIILRVQLHFSDRQNNENAGEETKDTIKKQEDKLLKYALAIDPESFLGSDDRDGLEEEKVEEPNTITATLLNITKRPPQKTARRFKFRPKISVKNLLKRLSPNLQENEWGKMIIQKIALTKIIPMAKNAFKPKPNYAGALRYPHRALPLVSDGAAFANKKRSHGGTILLDVSSSMSLTTADIGRLIRAFPMATIACYGELGDNNKECGRLSILAQNGQMVSEESLIKWREEQNNGNIVDGPALRWLAKRDRPRIWISDGEVTGIGDMQAPNLKIESKLITSRFRITRVDTIEECLKRFRHNKI